MSDGIAHAYGYDYDSIGNRLWSAENATTNTYTANSLNQYESVLHDSASPREMAFDADGNMTNDGERHYVYDAENRLLSAYPQSPTNGSLAVVNNYDHRHRRIRKFVRRFDGSAWDTVATHAFVWDGSNIALEKVAFADGTTKTCEYFWGPDKSGTEQGAGGVGGLLAVSIDGVFYVPCYDHNGNVVVYVSEFGATAAQYVYDPYGKVVEQSGDFAESLSFGFSTKYHDRETGMVSYQRRFYIPALGRWLNRDPIEEEGGENLYGMCGNDVVGTCDMLGLMWEIVRDGNVFATAIPKDRGDTFASLAREVELDLSDYKKWAHTSDKTPTLCKKYKIPNTIIYHKGVRSFYENWGYNVIGNWDAKNEALMKKERKDGFNVIMRETVDDADFLNDLSFDGLYEYTFTGHGKGGSIGVASKKYPFEPRRITIYGIHRLTLQACDSFNDMVQQGNFLLPGWAANVAKAGTFVGYVGDVRRLFGPEKDRRTRQGMNSGDIIIMRGENR